MQLSMLSEFKILDWRQREKNCFILKFFQIIFLFLLIKLIDLTLTTQKRPTPSLREETVLRLVRDNGLFPQKSVMS